MICSEITVEASCVMVEGEARWTLDAIELPADSAEMSEQLEVFIQQ